MHYLLPPVALVLVITTKNLSLSAVGPGTRKRWRRGRIICLARLFLSQDFHLHSPFSQLMVFWSEPCQNLYYLTWPTQSAQRETEKANIVASSLVKMFYAAVASCF